MVLRVMCSNCVQHAGLSSGHAVELRLHGAACLVYEIESFVQPGDGGSQIGGRVGSVAVVFFNPLHSVAGRAERAAGAGGCAAAGAKLFPPESLAAAGEIGLSGTH